MNNHPQKNFINVQKIIASKSPFLAKWMPRPLLNYFRRILREDDINKAMGHFGHLEGLEFIDAAFQFLNCTVHIEGAEKIPEDESIIIASNHPMGGLDGMAFMKAVGSRREDFKFLVNDVLLNIKNIARFFVPVNKVGENPREASRRIQEAYNQDQLILVFPAGLVSRKINGKVQDLEWKKSFIKKAIQHKKDILLVHIDGRNSNFFYNLARWRQRLGLKFNIEMLYLADEMFKQRDHTIHVRFGERLSWQSFDKSRTLDQWAELCRQSVYQIPKQSE